MREIKFRGKRLDGKGWAVGHLVKMWGAWHIIDWNDENTAYAVEPATVGQYIELKDKNGREIYEGDIIKTDFSYASWSGRVQFNRGNFELADSDKNGQYLSLSVLSNIENIGNIHDNPELLKSKRND